MKTIIAWFCRNSVAANLLLAAIFGAGLFQLRNIPLEGFPSLETDTVTVSMTYRGATPDEVEKTIILRIEEAVQDLEGIEELTSTAREGSGSVRIEVASGYDRRDVLEDVKNRVDAINTFPPETENPRFFVSQRIREAIGVAVYGQADATLLRTLAEEIRDEIANLPAVSQAEVTASRPWEVSVEIPEASLRAHGLTLDEVATAINRSSLDLPAGSLKTAAGEILVRTRAQAYSGDEFSAVTLISQTDGTRLALGDIANIRDDFEETPLFATFNGKPAVFISVRRVGDQSVIQIAKEVREYIENANERMPPGLAVGVTGDGSTSIFSRLQTLRTSAFIGLILVGLLLTLFLRLSVALWVCVGIPVCMLGAIAVMPLLGITLNLISVFAFILVLGIVVDDAIVVGENVYARMRAGMPAQQAAITGTQEVAVPVTFGVLTTMAAFVPLALVPGVRGQIFMQIPAIVIPVLFFSIIESKFILPAHLAHMKPLREKDRLGPLMRLQAAVANSLERFIDAFYSPVLKRALQWRYLTLAIFIGLLLVTVGIFRGGVLRFNFLPPVEQETVTASLTMPPGTPTEITESHIRHMHDMLMGMQEKYNRPDAQVIRDVSMLVGVTSARNASSAGQSHLAGMRFDVMDPRVREEKNIQVTAKGLIKEWREAIGPIPGAEDVSFRAEFGGGGDPVSVQLRGTDTEQLRRVAVRVREKLATFPGLFDISDSFSSGKEEITLRLLPEGEFLGITNASLARQVRHAFYGREAQRIQRGRDDVRVMVRLPRAERVRRSTLENFLVETPSGQSVPLHAVAKVDSGRGFNTIDRVDRQRVITVSADADFKMVVIEDITGELSTFLDDVLETEAGMTYRFEGQDKERRESFAVILYGMVLVLFAIYAMLAIPFKSYLQPLIVMTVIPFGFVGAIAGHLVMGKDLSIMSFFGMLALVGVVVNDSLVLVDYVNRARRERNLSLHEAVSSAGSKRFRPILLTSLTTFFGLMPMILEKATQAQFLIPMAISLGFGILFTTFVTLLLVPANYMILEDIRRSFVWLYGKPPRPPEPSS